METKPYSIRGKLDAIALDVMRGVPLFDAIGKHKHIKAFLARKLNVCPSTINDWRKRRVPLHRVSALALLLNVTESRIPVRESKLHRAGQEIQAGRPFWEAIKAHTVARIISLSVGRSEGASDNWKRRGIPKVLAPKIAALLRCDLKFVPISPGQRGRPGGMSDKERELHRKIALENFQKRPELALAISKRVKAQPREPNGGKFVKIAKASKPRHRDLIDRIAGAVGWSGSSSLAG